ncbi:MAG: putative Ig domain-containing protein, partial [Acidobacteria bacterium]|nr:putative Ig domain-containing protein [Acidobacteriota bacterium]
MNRRLFSAVSCLLCLTLAALPVSAGDEGQPVKGLSGPAQGSLPTVSRPTLSSVNPFAKPPVSEREAREPGTRISRTEMKRLKLLSEKPLPTGGREIHLDATPTPLAPNVGTNFIGMVPTVWIPYDAALAVGPNHIVVMTNSQWVVYDRNGNVVRAVTQFTTWWPNGVGGGAFDPKCVYDPVAGRFIIMAVSQSTGPNASKYHISVSQTGDPTGNWNSYDFDARLDGTTNTNNWADFPGLGYDDNAIYITSNQFSFSDIFQYAKIRVLSKAQLYAGAAATYTDFVNSQLLNADSTRAFTIQPARALSSTSSEYLLNTNSNANNKLTLWRIDGAPSAPVLVRQTTFTVGNFAVPPDAPQPGTGTLVATNDDRMYDVVWRSGVIHGAFGESFSGLAAVRYFRGNTTSNTVLKDITYTQPGTHYYFPAVTDDAAGNMYMFMSRSSSTEFASMYATGMQPADSAIQPSALIKAGTSTNTSGRWGDYNAIANDPADNLNVIGFAGWANVSNKWATWVANTTFSGSTPTPTLVSVIPSSGVQGTNVNVTLTGQNTNWVQGTSVIGISGSNVTASNVTVSSATSITATFNIGASAATGTRNVTVTTGTEVTTSAPFTVNAVAAPTLASISPNRGYIGVTGTHTLTGTNFVAGMSVNVSGTLVTPSNVNVTSSTQATVDLAVALNAALGNRNVSVTTAGGTSGTVIWKVVGVPVINSMSPTSGNPSAAVAVTVLGSEFTGGDLLVAGNGITLSNMLILNGGTKFTAKFNIAANAPSGPRNVTVVNPAGTSNAVVFTVNGGASPPTLASVTPANGDPGTAVNVSLAGTNFTTTSVVNVSGGDVSVTNLNVVNNGQITCTLNINAGAPGGPRNVTVTTGAGTSASQSFTVNGASAPLSVSTSSLPNGEVGASYNATLTATGGSPPYTWSLTSGALPGGLNLTPGTGAISGTPTGSGVFGFTAMVTDALSNTASAVLSISIATAPAITPSSLPGGQVGISYNASVQATGGTLPYSWSITSGALPNNVNLNSITGALSGTPTVAGTFNFTVTVTDAFGQTDSEALSIAVNPAVSVTTTSLPGGQVALSYNASLAATGGTLPYGWSISSGALPNGVNLDGSTGALSGTPTMAGTFNFTAVVTDGIAQTASNALSIVISSQPAPTLASISPNQGAQGSVVPVTLSGTNFVAPVTLNISGTVGLTASNVVLVNATTVTADFTVASGAAIGNRLISVTTPGGTSGTQWFKAVGLPSITSISPTGGARGTIVSVTLQGSQFQGGSASHT